MIRVFSLSLLGVLLCAQAIAAELSVERGLASYQVVQRDASDSATVTLSGSCPDAGSLTATVTGGEGPLEGWERTSIANPSTKAWEVTLGPLPAGGPYDVLLVHTSTATGATSEATLEKILVGDLWVLAGQSNMLGRGAMRFAEPPSEQVHVLRQDHRWDLAVEPLHRRWESAYKIHRRSEETPPTREESDRIAASETKGAGLGLPFAKHRVAETGVPIGLIPCAHGGSSLDHWNPDILIWREDHPSLYGAFLKSVERAGGRVAGVLWYQGEKDTVSLATATAYREKFVRFIGRVRKDLGNARLPFLYVQLGLYLDRDREGWNAVRESQRLAEPEVENATMVTALDLPLNDRVHIDTAGHKILGRRFANVLSNDVLAGPRFESVSYAEGEGDRPPMVLVRFAGVNGELLPAEKLRGFSIRDSSENELPVLADQYVNPNEVGLVRLVLNKDLPRGSFLWYAHGGRTFANLTDSENMAAPAMGPIEIP